MRYLQKAMQMGERPLCRSHLHWIYMVSAMMWFLGLSALGWVLDYNLWVRFGAYIPAYEINMPNFHLAVAPGWLGWMLTAGGAYIFAIEFIKFLSTDLVMTNKRLLYKTGLLKVKIDATDINDILGVHIDQGWFGQFFGYGKIHLDCRFIEDVYIPYVRNPYGIMKALEKAKTQSHGEIPMIDETQKDDGKERVVSQTLIQITGSNPVYFVDKVPEDVKTPLTQLPKNLGENMMNAFRKKA